MILIYRDTNSTVAVASALLTDSGGIQREVLCLDAPCVPLRDATHWVETLQGGSNRTLAASTPGMLKAAGSALERKPEHTPARGPFGGATVAQRITELLEA